MASNSVFNKKNETGSGSSSMSIRTSQGTPAPSLSLGRGKTTVIKLPPGMASGQALQAALAKCSGGGKKVVIKVKGPLNSKNPAEIQKLLQKTMGGQTPRLLASQSAGKSRFLLPKSFSPSPRPQFQKPTPPPPVSLSSTRPDEISDEAVVEMLTSGKGKSPEASAVTLVPVEASELNGLGLDNALFTAPDAEARLLKMARESEAAKRGARENPIVDIQSVSLSDETSSEQPLVGKGPAFSGPERVVLPMPIEDLVNDVKRDGKWVKTNRWTCVECRIYYDDLENLREHQRTVHQNKVYVPNIRRHADAPIKDPRAESLVNPSTNNRISPKKILSEAQFENGDPQETIVLNDDDVDDAAPLTPARKTSFVGEVRYRCAACGSEFPLESSLKKHAYNVHTQNYADVLSQSMCADDDGDFPHCFKCNGTFSNKLFLFSHKCDGAAAKSNPEYTCDVCGVQCESRQQLGGHVKNCRGNRLDCSMCAAFFHDRQKLLNHMKKKHPSQADMDTTKSIAPLPEKSLSLAEQLGKEDFENPFMKRIFFQYCLRDGCDSIFSTEDQLRDHNEKFHGAPKFVSPKKSAKEADSIPKTICEARPPNVPESLSGTGASSRPLQISQSGHVSISGRALDRVRILARSKVGKILFGKNVKIVEANSNNVVRAGNALRLTSVPVKNLSKNDENAFSTIRNIGRIQLQNQKETRLYPCDRPLCEALFLDANSLQEHQKSDHSLNVRLICEVCEEQFVQRNHLAIHLSERHGKTLRQNAVLRTVEVGDSVKKSSAKAKALDIVKIDIPPAVEDIEEVKEVSEVEPSPIKITSKQNVPKEFDIDCLVSCNECRATLPSQSCLTLHSRRAHGPVLDAQAVMEEVETNFGLGWNCRLCWRHFERTSSLRAHSRNQHGSEDLDQLLARIETNEGQGWPCPRCGDRFDLRHALNTHLNSFVKCSASKRKEKPPAEKLRTTKGTSKKRTPRKFKRSPVVKRLLKTSIERLRSSLRRYKCRHCSFACSDFADFRAHSKRHPRSGFPKKNI